MQFLYLTLVSLEGFFKLIKTCGQGAGAFAFNMSAIQGRE